AAAEVKQAAAAVIAQHNATISTWLSPEELRSQIQSRWSSFENRDIRVAGKWPVIESKWPTSIPENIRKWTRGLGAKFEPLPDRAAVWQLMARDPQVFAPELLGYGTLHLRYYADVYDPKLTISYNFGGVHGQPIVTVLAYYLKPAETEAAAPRPSRYLLFRYRATSFVWGETCDGAIGTTFCTDLVALPNDGRASKQFDWDKFLKATNAYSMHQVVRSEELASQVEGRLNQQLTGEQQKLINEVQREDSAVYRAINNLDASVAAIRGVVSLALRTPLYQNDSLRSALYGRINEPSCAYRKSRSERQAPGAASVDLPQADAIKSLETPKIVAGEAPPMPKDEVKECDESNLARASGQLIDRVGITSLLGRSLNSDGKVVPAQISEITLLQNIDSIATTSWKAL